MRRISIFLVVLVVTMVVLVSLVIVSWYYAVAAPSIYGSSWMGQMWGSHLGTNSDYGMGGMMGNGSTLTPSYLWLVPITLGAIIAIGVIGVAFYYAYPELKYIKADKTCTSQSVTPTIATAAENKTVQTINESLPTVSNNCDVLLKTLNPDEKKVLNVLVAHNGKYLQKHVVKETGLSRLKTHRIVARFAERGIVTIKEFGNTNELVLSDWVKS
jgi:hypothetical protein